jgi:hypothetical protein
MKYETPELIVLAPVLNAVQGSGTPKNDPNQNDGSGKEHTGTYTDWED